MSTNSGISPSPRRGEGRGEGNAQGGLSRILAMPPPHPNPHPRGEREARRARELSLLVTTPTAVAAQLTGLRHLRAEDASGAFGVWPGHADLLTALAISVISWRTADGHEGHCAVRGGVLTVRDGARIAVATREAVVGDDLHALERDVLARFRRNREEEGEARSGARRMHLAAIRHILAYLRPDRRPSGPFTPAPDGGEEAS